MATDQLSLYNIALASVGVRVLDGLAEQTPERRQLDEIWDRGKGVRVYCLEQGLWNFAMRESSSTASSTGNFNFAQRHATPTDLIRLSAISAGETFNDPLLRYEFQSSSIWTDEETIYLRYVSNSSTAGLNYDLWPDTFTLYVGSYMGLQLAPYVWSVQGAAIAERNIPDREGLTKKLDALRKNVNRILIDARSKDAQQEPTRFPPAGTWVTARHGGYASRRDGGSRTSLIG